MMIKVKWTPQNAVFHRKVNVHAASDQSVPVKDRMTTFDGSTINCLIGAPR